MAGERVGTWQRVARGIASYFCLSCGRWIANGEPSWRAANGTDTGRRLCVECMEKRQEWRKKWGKG
jgi:hypothetical protein